MPVRKFFKTEIKIINEHELPHIINENTIHPLIEVGAHFKRTVEGGIKEEIEE